MRFYGQEAQEIQARKVLIILSTCVTYIRHYATDCPSYGITKLAENLAGNFAVWAASPEAEFIHGRFVWAAWDVEELKTRIEDGVKKNPRFLMAGIEGLSASIDGI
ncbi:hypothetical protein Focb16_v015280 [Fusarium oxysporum f. sp. cubense]|uniref:Uncharacterized protein n=1 Tax=Fusarium oxysporum f. sp. cubense TaxID=61366 RepID=A0A559KTU0_FUSOC|nr:hypothetical protein Focb16_v015280 [Fusarium oxysporum f. sp. cubense]